MSEKYQFIATEASFFSGKLRAYLRYQKIPFTEIDSTLSVMKNIVLRRVGKMIIPIIITPDDECLQDTSLIIDYFEARNTGPSVYPETQKQKLVSLMLETFGDEWLGIYALHDRWNHGGEQRKFTVKDFGETAVPNGNKFTQYIGYKLFSLPITRYLKRACGSSKAIAPGIEKSYGALVSALDFHLSKYPYMLGGRPCISDYSFVGLFYGHQYRDPHPSKYLHKYAPNVIKWIERVQLLQDPKYGDLLPNDEIPDTLVPILEQMTREQFPELKATSEMLDRWIVENPDADEIKRFLGMHAFDIGGMTGKRQYVAFSCWMHQRAVDYYNSVEDKTGLDELLTSINGKYLFDNQAKNRVEYKNYKLSASREKNKAQVALN